MQTSPPKPNDKLISAEFDFGKVKLPPKELPTFTIADLHDMGVRFIESDTTRLVEVPFIAQKKLLESLKVWGFGASAALNDMIHGILNLYGFDGKTQTRVDEKTFTWVAFQPKEPAK